MRSTTALVALTLLLGGCGVPLPGAELSQDFPLTVQRAIDGDSFVASDGLEYRVGMINAPENGTCGGEESARAVADLLADGFSVEAYAEDRFGRSVTRVRTPEGDLGVLLAEQGLADDRYLAQFATENPDYAADLVPAFEEAEQDRVGLWATCWADDGPD